MFNIIKNNYSALTVREEGILIHANGLCGYTIVDDFKKYWNTDKIGINMFTRISRFGISFYSFFTPDLLYAIDVIINSPKKTFKSVRSLYLLKEELLKNTRFSSLNKEINSRLDYSKLKNLEFIPKDYQLDFFNSYDSNTQKYFLNGYLLAATPGSGKTNMSLSLIELLNIKKILIIAPMNAVNEVWVEHIKNKVYKRTRSCSTSENIDYSSEFIIVHYEYLDKIDYAKFDKDTSIILDESHNFNEISSKRTNLFLNLCKCIGSKDILLLSGTPIKALSSESIPLLRAIDPLFNLNVEESFKRIYKSNNNRGSDILINRLGLMSYKVEKHQLSLKPPIFNTVKIKINNSDDYTLPTIKSNMSKFIRERLDYYKSRNTIDLELYNKGIGMYYDSIPKINNKELLELDLYKSYVSKLIETQGVNISIEIFSYCNKYELEKIYPFILNVNKELAKEWKDIRSTIKYVTLKVRGECLGKVVGGSRIKCHVDMIPYIDFNTICESTIKKTVVFTSFVEVIEKCITVFPSKGLNGVFVYAKTNKKLSDMVNGFNKDIKINPLVATYKSLSTAVPLTMADTMILIDSPFRDYMIQQAVSRIHRLDSDTQVNIYVCELDTGDIPNISTRSKEILQWSQKQIEQIIGISSPYILTELDDGIYDLDQALESFSNKPSFLNI